MQLPISELVWSMWRRCCDAAELPMGPTVVALITRELSAVVDESDASILTRRAVEQLAAREAQVADRERKAEVAEE